MTWKAPRPALEIAFESLAVASLSGAVAFAVWRLAPAGGGGASLGWAVAAGAMAGVIGLMVMARIDRSPDAAVMFDLIGVEAFAAEVEDVLLLDEPIVAAPSQSRVVQLFAAAPPAPTAPSDESAHLPEPGEMAARIEDFLRPARSGGAGPDERIVVAMPDANAALHDALADIRRSLRQG